MEESIDSTFNKKDKFNTQDMEGAEMKTPSVKMKKLGLKRIAKKKSSLNISKGNLKSVSTPKNFSFLNMSVQKQTLRANNRALAKNLANIRQELRFSRSEVTELQAKNQEMKVELNRLKCVVGLKDSEIDDEVQKRMKNHMRENRILLEELTQYLLQSSSCLTMLHDKCVTFSRRSTTNSRPASTGNDSAINDDSTQDQLNVQQRGMFGGSKTKSSNSFMKNYLSKADEYAPPTIGSVASFSGSDKANMSIIAEQSMIDEDQFDCEGPLRAVPLMAVSEASDEMPADVGVLPKESISRLPQRVLKSSVKTSTTPIVKKSSPQAVENSRTESVMNDRVKTNSPIQKTLKSKSNQKDGIEQISKVEKSDEVNKLNGKRDQKDEKVDSNSDGDISSFGFGGSFADNLESASPIAGTKEKKEENKRRETFVLPKPSSTLFIDKTGNSRQEKNVSHKNKTKVTPPEKCVKTSSKCKTSSESSKNKQKLNKPVKNVSSKTENNSLKSKPITQSCRNTFTTTNPFVSKSSKVLRSPVKDMSEDRYIDPFKPTKNLLRSPIPGAPPKQNLSSEIGNSPVEKVDSLGFLARLTGSLDNRSNSPERLIQPSFPDEPTMFFNSEMEFTSVIDATALTQSLRGSNRPSPNVPLSQTETSNKNEQKVGKAKKAAASDTTEQPMKQKSRSKHSSKSKIVETDSKMDPELTKEEAAAVEVRTNKPGVFTYSVGRKEADGSRKAVPDKVSKARSKKKKITTPEKDPHRTGADRDMFSFGDRTPTVPLEMLTKPKSVYDLSMNETVASPPLSLNNFREKMNHESVHARVKSKSNTDEKTENKPDEHIYYLPMPKGSPDEKPLSKPRSQSRTRSKSKNRNDSDNEDWKPGQRSKSRARSKSRKSKDSDNEDVQPNTGSKSRTRSKSTSGKPNDSDNEEMEIDQRSKSRTRSKSRISDDSDNEIIVSRQRSKSRGRSRVRKSDELTNDNVTSSKSRQTWSKSKVRQNNDIDDTDVKVQQISSRSRSRARKKSSSDDDDSPVKLTKKNVKLSAHIVVDSNEKEESSLMQPESSNFERKSRSRSTHRKKTNVETVCVSDSSEGEPIVESLKVSVHDKKSVDNLHSEGIIYNLPLKDSQDVPKQKKMGRSRSQSRILASELDHLDDFKKMGTERSQSRSGSVRLIKDEENDDNTADKEKETTDKEDIDIDAVKSSKSLKSIHREKTNEEAICVSESSEGEPVVEPLEDKKSGNSNLHSEGMIYNLPLKDSQDVPKQKQMGRSRSRSRVLASELDDLENFKKVVTERSKSSRSVRLVKDEENDSNTADKEKATTDKEDIDIDAVKSSRSARSIHREKTNEEAIFVSESSEGEPVVEPLEDKKSGNSNLHSEGMIYNLPLKDSQDVPKQKQMGRSRSRSRVLASELDDLEDFKKVVTERSKSRSKSARLVKDEENDDNTADKKKPTTDKEEVTTDAVKSSRSPRKTKPVTDKEKAATDKKEIKMDAVKSSRSARKTKPVTDKDKVKTDVEAEASSSKSSKKNLDKNLNKGNKEKEQLTGEERLRSKTPATTKAKTSSKSTKSKTQKSVKKRKVEVKTEDETPKVKQEKSTKKTVDKENDQPLDSSLEGLKRRLTMMAAGNEQKSSLAENEDGRRKRLFADLSSENNDLETEGIEQASETKRSRRNISNVSYVPPKINAKMRQGDNQFDSPKTKAKAEKARLQLMLAMKTTTVFKERPSKTDNTPS